MQMKKCKVLVLPSWYPTPEQPSLGIFFKEQAQLLSEDFELKVLYGEPNLIGRKKFVTFFLSNTFFKRDISLQKETIGLLEECYFSYPQVTFYSFAKQVRDVVNYFTTALKQLGWEPDIIHAQSFFPAGVIGLKLKERFNSKLVVTEHLPLIIKNFDLNKKEALISCLNGADAVSTVSEYSKMTLLDNAPKIEVKVHGNFVNETIFQLKEEQKVSVGGRFKIGWVGSPYYRKDPFTFLKAVSHFHKEVKNVSVRLVFASEKADFPIQKVKEYAKELGVFDICSFEVGLNRESLNKFYKNQDVLVCTSVSETFGLIIAESLMCGTPVISTKNGGASDIIQHGKNGFLVKIKDYEAISNFLKNICKGKKKFHPQTLRTSSIKKFGTTAFKKNISTLYKTTIKS